MTLSAPKAVLLDIDGTMMTSSGAGRLALVRAAARRFDRDIAETRERLAALDFRGSTDALIFEDVDRALGLGLATGTRAADLAAAYLEELDLALSECRCEALPGIAALVRALSLRPYTRCGVLTGNLRLGAHKKLAKVGLERVAEGPSGFGEDGRERRQIAAVAVERLAAVGVKPWATLVIGDTPRDVEAAHAVGAPAVAVATGGTPREVLERCDAQLVVPDLADPGPVLALLEAL